MPHALFALVSDWLKQRHAAGRFVPDSFPVVVCHHTRIPRCKLLTGKSYNDCRASKRGWFYGLRMQVVATSDGVSVKFYLHVGSESEQADEKKAAVLGGGGSFFGYGGGGLPAQLAGSRAEYFA